MKNRMFDIVTLSDHQKCCYPTGSKSSNQLNGIIDEGISVIRGIIDIFSGGSGSGLPGDYANRVRLSHQWAIDKNVKECVDYSLLERYITEPGIWQNKVSEYIQQLATQKINTGSCQSVFGMPGGVTSGATLFPPGSSSNLLLIAGGIALLFFLQNKKKKKINVTTP